MFTIYQEPILKFSRNAMVLNAAVAAIYVAIGSFRALLSFKGS